MRDERIPQAPMARRDLVALVAAILSAGRCSPTGGTLIDPDTLVTDALALVDRATIRVVRGL